mmetsp:Transcript_41482/g.97279  ORF Transcript_41482/g.97279 Transcript_41482/m.97279 type:complete len:156 (-) Transcript_41482:37-504(-)|eukprot:CAMPEP_0117048966 /NCGR_PEP_ID=MMETSP0472-20121206/33859_1 /TAXON_ID=693140 ORGANISM="Tiarina fusus, Strain LIS" /NCGR_SAMPLE_ID=MMETSP0472 /ASSEMBLY_ACC=CAM_ASM_000603 /LENGTH=155 /DNA_ID=CAMNT_0004762289 /DNA_START=11 /DNA_END=478 /DNA_ORIENTATION=+
MVQSEYGSVSEVAAVPSVAPKTAARRQLAFVGGVCLVAMALLVLLASFGGQWGDSYGEPTTLVSHHLSHQVASAILDASGSHKNAGHVPKNIAKTAEEAAQEVQNGLKPTVKLSPLSPKLQKMLKQAQAEINIEHSIDKKKAAVKKAAKGKKQSK